MDKNIYFEGYERRREAEEIMPPHTIKDKVGSGGIDPARIEKADSLIEEKTQNFSEIADIYIPMLEENINKAGTKELNDTQAFEMILHPAVQLKSHGSMYHFPLVTEVGGMLINFLEVIKELDKNALEVTGAYAIALKAITTQQIKQKDDPQGRQLVKALQDASVRYFKSVKP